MIRLFIAFAIVAAIFMHSPARSPDGVSQDIAHLKEMAGRELVSAAQRSPLLQSIGESALRQTLTAGPQEPLSTPRGPHTLAARP